MAEHIPVEMFLRTHGERYVHDHFADACAQVADHSDFVNNPHAALALLATLDDSEIDAAETAYLDHLSRQQHPRVCPDLYDHVMSIAYWYAYGVAEAQFAAILSTVRWDLLET